MQPRNIVRVTAPRSVVPAQPRSSGSLATVLLPAAVAVAGMLWTMLRHRKPAPKPEPPEPAALTGLVEVRIATVAVIRRVEL